MKTTFLAGLMIAAVMNLAACTVVPSMGGCSAVDPDVDMHVAPLTFEPTSATETCDAKNGVVLDLTDAEGSSIRVAVQSFVQLGDSLPLTMTTAATGDSVASSSDDGAVKVSLTDAEYNELPGGWQNAAVTIDTVPQNTSETLSGELHVYFADGRTLDVGFDNVLQTACAAPQTN